VTTDGGVHEADIFVAALGGDEERRLAIHARVALHHRTDWWTRAIEAQHRTADRRELRVLDLDDQLDGLSRLTRPARA
jgi:hypothetical protein